MKKIAFYVCLYGREYLAWSIRSIQDAVDEIHVLYTDRPSFGHNRDLVCPESEEELLAEARRFCNKPLFWKKGRWDQEGAHRDAIYPIAREHGASQILVVDTDELWLPGSAKSALDVAATYPEGIVRVRFLHFYRSLKWLCIDPCMPVRIINLKPEGGPKPAEHYLSPQDRPVLHTGYAQSVEMVAWKWKIHGHQSEYRNAWLESKFIGWQPGMVDVHPTCLNFWTPEQVKPEFREEMKAVLGDHPYFDKDLIP